MIKNQIEELKACQLVMIAHKRMQKEGYYHITPLQECGTNKIKLYTLVATASRPFWCCRYCYE